VIAKKSYPKRSSKPIARKARPRKRNPARKAREFARTYHSVERVEFVKGMPCAACGVVGYSENAHLPPKGEAGAGYKADYRFIAPMCGPYWHSGGKPCSDEKYDALPYNGCHYLYDKRRWAFVKLYPDFDAEQACQQTEELWLHHLAEKSA
jgi:hypothetical protein